MPRAYATETGQSSGSVEVEGEGQTDVPPLRHNDAHHEEHRQDGGADPSVNDEWGRLIQ